MRNFGFGGLDNVIYIGTNGKMTEVCAAMGLTSLESLDEFVQANRRNYRAYVRGLSGIPGVTLMRYDESEQGNYQYVVAEIDEREAGLSRDELFAVLSAENVLARRYFFPGCHRMEPYRSYFPLATFALHDTEELCLRTMVLPTGTSVDEQAIDQICQIIRIAVLSAQEVRMELANTETNRRGMIVRAIRSVP